MWSFLSSQCLIDTCAHGDALKHTHTALIYPVRHSKDTEVECSDAVLKIKARSSDISTIKSSFSYFPLCKYQLIFLLLNPGQAIVKYKSLTCILRDATNAVTSDCSHLVFKGLNWGARAVLRGRMQVMANLTHPRCSFTPTTNRGRSKLGEKGYFYRKVCWNRKRQHSEWKVPVH